MRIWIVLADSSRARIFSCHGKAGALREVKGLIHPKSLSKRGEILTDRAGRIRTGLRGRGVTAMSAHSDPRELECGRFAADIAKALTASWEGGEFEYLALVAPPRFLGQLRGKLDESVRRRTVACVAKEVTLLTPRELRPHLSEVFESARRAQLKAQEPGVSTGCQK